MHTSRNCILAICAIILLIYFGWCCVQGARLLNLAVLIVFCGRVKRISGLYGPDRLLSA